MEIAIMAGFMAIWYMNINPCHGYVIFISA